MLSLPALLLLSATPLAPADTLHRRWVPADAGVVVHLDLQALLDSEVGRLAAHRLGTMNQENIEGFREWTRSLDLVPGRDVRAITVWGEPGGGGTPVAVVSMSSTAERIFEALPPEASHTSTEVDGHVVHSIRARAGEDEQELFAWVGEPADGAHPVVFTPGLDALFDALLVIEGAAPSLADSEGPLARRAPQPGTFFFLAGRDLGGLDPSGTTSRLLKESAEVVLEIGEHDGRFFAEATVAAKDEGTAASIADVAQGLLALARLTVLRDDTDADVRALRTFLLDGLRVSGEGREIRIAFHTAAPRLARMLRENAERLRGREEK